MFRMGLLTSTAMTAVALLLSGGADAAQAQTGMHDADRDANARFLCTYGQFEVSNWYNLDSGSFHSTWTHVAAPVMGNGQTVSRIRVVEAQGYSSSSVFTVGIYRSNARGLPGKAIVTGTGTISPICGPVNVFVPPTRLKRKTKYWIEETVQDSFSGLQNHVYWEANPKTKRHAYVQHHTLSYSSFCSCGSSYTSPWTKQTTGPYLKLK